MQLNHDETSEALLAAAHRLLAEQGADALTVRRIATEAGMSTMNVYSRFGGKDGVIDELYIAGFDRLFAEIDAVPETDDFATDLMELARAYRRFAMDNPTYYKVMFRGAIHEFVPSPRATDVALNGLQVFIDRIRHAQEQEHIRADADNPAIQVAAWLWATCHGLVSLELSAVADERVDWPSVFENGMRTSVDGLHPTIARLH